MRTVKKIFLWLIGIIFFLIIQAFVLIHFFSDEIKQAVVKEINNTLKVEVKVGPIEFSAFNHFPYISLILPDIEAQSTFNDGKPLIKAKQLAFLFNFWDLYNKKIAIRKMLITDAEINIKINRLGEDNFHFWKSSSSSSTGNTNIQINQVILKNVKVNYLNEKMFHEISSTLTDGEISGDFGAEEFKMNLNSTLLVHRLAFSKVNYLEEKMVNTALSLKINPAKETYSFDAGKLQIGNLNFIINGLVQGVPKGNKLDIKIGGEKVDLAAFLSLLPNSISDNVKEYSSSGTFYFDASMTGLMGKTSNPNINVDFGIQNGTILSKQYKKALTAVNLKGNFNNGVNQSATTASITLDPIQAKLEGEPLSGRFAMSNFDKPFINTSLIAKLNLADAKAFIPSENLVSASGKAHVNLFTKGQLDDLKSGTNLWKTKTGGTVLFDNATLNIKDLAPIKIVKGMLDVDNAYLKISELIGKYGDSDFNINGTCQNLPSFLLTGKNRLEIEGNLTSGYINLKDFGLADREELNPGPNQSSAQAQTAPEPYSFVINPGLSARLSVDIRKLEYRDFSATSLGGNIAISQGKLSTSNLAFKSMDGSVKVSGELSTSVKNTIMADVQASVKKINIKKLFISLENFGQDVIIDKNLEGLLTAEINSFTLYDPQWNIKTDKILVTTDVLIEEGKLLNFEPLLALGSFVDVNELRDLQFSTLKNTINIKKETIFIPTMEIVSNAIDLTISGTHTFENIVDYKIKVLISQLLAKKSNKLKNTEFGVVEDDGSGKTALFIKMTGPINDPKIAYDKVSTKEQIKTEFQQEKKELKKIINDEINSILGKPKTSSSGEDIPTELQGAKKVESETKKDRKAAWRKFRDKLKDDDQELPPD
jgi:hypothetical protein